MAETQKEKIMRLLGVSAAEADEIIAYDRAVNQGKKTQYDLTKEQEKEVRKYRQADRAKPFIPDLKPRERKANEPKRELIEIIKSALENAGISDISVTNVERQLDFSMENVKYRIVLSAPRK